MSDRSEVYYLCIQPSHPGQLILAIPPSVGEMCTHDGYNHNQGTNSKFCITVSPFTRTAGMLTQSVKVIRLDEADWVSMPAVLVKELTVMQNLLFLP